MTSADWNHPDKILTVRGEQLQESDVIEAVEEAGFDISPLATSGQ